MRDVRCDILTPHIVVLEKYASTLIVRIVELFFPRTFLCALIILSNMHVCLALAVVVQIKITHDRQMSNSVQIARYYSRTFF